VNVIDSPDILNTGHSAKIAALEPSTATSSKKEQKLPDGGRGSGSNSGKESPRITAPRRRSSDLKNSIA